MSNFETIAAAADGHCLRASKTPGQDWVYGDVREAFIAGVAWQTEQSVGRLVPRTVEPTPDPAAMYKELKPQVSGVSQTEIMAEILTLKNVVLNMQHGLGQQAGQNYSNLMAMLEAINKAVVGGVTGLVQDAQFELRHMIVDVGQKVEAVLAVVTEDDKKADGGKMDPDGTMPPGMAERLTMHDETDVLGSPAHRFVHRYDVSPVINTSDNSHLVSELREQLRVAQIGEAFWRKVAAARSDYAAVQREQIKQMGDMFDALTGKTQ